MSSKNYKNKENDVDLQPPARKRIKSVAPTDFFTQSWLLPPRAETVSSPSSLNAEVFEEMGLGMLDSEENSSSSASAIALALSSTDENSNEPTNSSVPPNLRSKLLALRQVDRPLVNTADNIQIGLTDSQNNIKGSDAYDNTKRKSDNSSWAQNKQICILDTGGGALVDNTSPLNEINTSPGMNVRSPLATVTYNQFIKMSSNIQQHLQSVPGYSNVVLPNSITALVPYTGSSPQAAFTKRQQPQQTSVPLKQELKSQQSVKKDVANNDKSDFFLFRNSSTQAAASDGQDHFDTLSDEIVLQVFKWLPKKALIRCSSVCRRFNRCARDESLWTRLDLGGLSFRPLAFDNILTRGVVILRLAQSQLNSPLFAEDFETKLQYLDLSMVTVAKPELKMLLSRCRHLKKLSLEHVSVNDDVCDAIAQNTNLEALNLTMCLGLEAWSVRKMMKALINLNSLNISWTNLTVDAVTSLVTNVSPNLMRLNVAGCRKTMFDTHLSTLAKRSPNLLELDLSDCTGLTGNAIAIICNFKMLEYLSLSRCYLIPSTAYMGLRALPTLTYLDVFGVLSSTAIEMMEENFPTVGLNKFIHSSVARPTVGTRRTSIWGLRTRD